MDTKEEIQMNMKEVPEPDPKEVDALIDELEKKTATSESVIDAGGVPEDPAKEVRRGNVFMSVYDDAISDDAIVALFKSEGWIPVGLTHNETQIGIQCPENTDVAVAYSGGRFFLFEGQKANDKTHQAQSL